MALPRDEAVVQRRCWRHLHGAVHEITRLNHGKPVSDQQAAVNEGGQLVVIPVVPFLALEFNATDLEISYVYSGYAFAAMISGLYSGWLSDKFGRRPAFLLSLFGSAVGFVTQAMATDIEQFIAFRVLAGSFGGSATVAFAYIGDVAKPSERPRLMSLVGVTIGVMFMVGPGIGSALSQFTLQTPMWVASALAGSGLLMAFAYLKEPSQLLTADELDHNAKKSAAVAEQHDARERRLSVVDNVANDDELENAVASAQRRAAEAEAAALAAEAAERAGDAAGTGDAASAGAAADTQEGERSGNESKPVGSDDVLVQDTGADEGPAVAEPGTEAEERATDEAELNPKESPVRWGNLILWNFATFLVGVSFAGIQLIGPLKMAATFEWKSLEIGMQMMSNATLLTFVQLLVYPKVLKRVGLVGSAFIGLIFFGTGLFLIGQATADVEPMAIVGYLTVFGGFGFYSPTGAPFIASQVPRSQTGRHMGLNQFCNSGGMILGPIIIASIYESDPVMGFVTGAAVAWAAGVVVFVGIAIPERRRAAAADALKSAEDAVQKNWLATTSIEDFGDELRDFVLATLKKRNFDLKYKMARVVAKEIIDEAIPFLRPEGEGRKEDINALVTKFGHAAPFTLTPGTHTTHS